MDEREILANVASIISTLVEVGTDVAESTVYMSMDMNLDKYQTIRGIMLGMGVIKISHNRISLTPSGVELGAKLNDLYKDISSQDRN